MLYLRVLYNEESIYKEKSWFQSFTEILVPQVTQVEDRHGVLSMFKASIKFFLRTKAPQNFSIVLIYQRPSPPAEHSFNFASLLSLLLHRHMELVYINAGSSRLDIPKEVSNTI